MALVVVVVVVAAVVVAVVVVVMGVEVEAAVVVEPVVLVMFDCGFGLERLVPDMIISARTCVVRGKMSWANGDELSIDDGGDCGCCW